MAAHNLNKNGDFNSINTDIIPLDTRVKHEYDNLESFSCHSRAQTRESRKTAFRIAQSGRSMVEMLGVLAVIGVLSIGGIMGYSYGMDKYRANETTNQIMLRAIDLMTQSGNNNETLSFASWINEASQYDFGTPEYTNDGLIVFDVGTNEKMPKRVCEIVYDAMKDMAVQIDINAVRADSNDACGDDNEMTFYFEGGIGATCDPACPEGQYCDNGICFKGDKPEMTKFFEVCSGYGDDCGECRSCVPAFAEGYVCRAVQEGSPCTIDEKDGVCRSGACCPKGCTSNEDCTEPGTYCASPNDSSTERFPSGTTGFCAPIDFVRYEGKDGNTYYISNTTISWWDAEFACDAIGRKELLSVDDLVTESDGTKWQGDTGYHTKTALAEELYDLSGDYYVWTQNLKDDKKSAFTVYLDRGNVSYYNTRGSDGFAVCQ
ncbi:MAG: hypothetical protein IKY98_01555 [Alphaproteobacteria bacterium]|nr:hypothetical protein [Alphaproteobacteria bacterium]